MKIHRFSFRLAAVLGLLTAFLGTTDAQQLPLRTNWQFNYFQENPAFAGFSDCLELKAGYRQQWAGFDGAPQTAFANLQGEIARSPGGNIHGFGGRVTDDSAGPYGFTQLDLAYAYHMKMAKGWRLAAGAAFGFMQYRLALGDIVLPDFQAGNDPAITSSANQLLAPTLDFGVWTYNKYTFWGLSVQNLIEPSVDQWGLDTRFRRHVGFYGGSLIRLEGPWSFHPAGSLRFSAGAPVAVDVQALFDYDEVIRFGVAYRNETALSGLFTLKLMDNVTVGYAYDWNVGPLSQAASSTHEFTLGILACPVKGSHVPCAAFQ